MSQAALNVTPNALKVFQDVINKGEEVDPSNALVRVMIAGKTATEYEYTMGLTEKDEDPAEHMRDSFYEFGDIEVVVDDVSIKSLKGSTIDYKEDLNAAGFVIDNPNKPERIN
jgi:iron-sulfur cluster assembly accessory protein